MNDRFTYASDLAAQEGRPGRCELRLAPKLALAVGRHPPRCLGGLGAPPPDLCGGAVALERLRGRLPPAEVVWRTKGRRAGGWRAGHGGELRQLQPWIQRKLERRVSNQQLGQGGRDLKEGEPAAMEVRLHN